MPVRRVGIVADLWRYPVKSFGGQRARHVFVGPYGLQGDRCHAVVSPGGALVTARRATRMLGFGAAFRSPEGAGDVVVRTPDGDEFDVDDPALGAALTAAMGREVLLARAPAGVFDAAPVHLVTDASVARMGDWVGEEVETRRFRPNIVVELDAPEAFVEHAWVGARLRLGGSVEVDVVSPTERCAVTTIDPDTLHRDDRVLACLARERENLFGVYANVHRPGWLRVGDPVHLVPTDPRSG